MILRDLAHSRTGDKGRIVNLSVIVYDAADYAWLERFLTADRVKDHLGMLIAGQVERYVLPHLHAMNFVAHRPPGHSVTRTLALDAHGKSLSAALLEMNIPDRRSTS